MSGHFTATLVTVFTLLLEAIDGTGPGVSVSVSPGQNLWVGEDLILECRCSAGRDGLVVWHRLLLDTAIKGDTDIAIKGDRVAELLSHGDTLLLEDQRFSLLETQFEDSTVYRLKIEGVRVSDSGKYECQVADMDHEKDDSQYIQIDVYHNNNNIKQEGKYVKKKFSGKSKSSARHKSDVSSHVDDYNVDTEYLGDSVVESDEIDDDEDNQSIIKDKTKSVEISGKKRRQSVQQREVSSSAFVHRFTVSIHIFLCLVHVIK